MATTTASTTTASVQSNASRSFAKYVRRSVLLWLVFLPLAFVVIIPLLYIVSMAFTMNQNQLNLPHSSGFPNRSQFPTSRTSSQISPCHHALVWEQSARRQCRHSDYRFPVDAQRLCVCPSGISGQNHSLLAAAFQPDDPRRDHPDPCLLAAARFEAAEHLLMPSGGRRAASVTGIFLMRQHFYAIPNELEDAARVDGAGRFRIYWQICLPLVRGAMVALAIFTFLGMWNDLFWPLIVLSNRVNADPAGGTGGDPAGKLHPARSGLCRRVYCLGAGSDVLRHLPAQDHCRHHDHRYGRTVTARICNKADNTLVTNLSEHQCRCNLTLDHEG